MAISINGTTGVITGVSEGGLPDGSVNTADIKDLSITGDKLGTGSVSADKIGSGAVTSAKLDSGVTSSIDAKAPLSQPEFTGSYVKIPVVTTTQRDALTPTEGYFIYNSTVHKMQQYTENGWESIASPPILTSSSYPNSQTAISTDGGDVITLTGANFEVGVNVKFGNTYATSVTRNSSTSLSVTTPVLTAGDYDIIVENATGLNATLTNGVSVNDNPVFTTASGNIGSIYNDQTMSTISIVATETDSGSITYEVTTGSLPTGLSISNGGDITGTATGYSAETTVNFTVTATDDENQTAERQFNIIVLLKFYLYELNQSLRFNDDTSEDYLTWTPSSAGNRKTWTWSSWVKRGNLGYQFLLSTSDLSSTSLDIRFESDNTLSFGGAGAGRITTDAVFRDVSAWYHIVCVLDTTESTDTDRLKIYVNGALQSVTGTYPSLNYDGYLNQSVPHNLGAIIGASGAFFDGYMAEVNFIDGQALDPTSLGEFKQDIWIPKEYAGTYGSNGFYLDFSDTGTPTYTYNQVSTLTDSSGNYSPTFYNVSISTNQAKYGSYSAYQSSTTGGTSPGGYVSVTQSSSVSPTGSNSITYETWIYFLGDEGQLAYGYQSDWFSPGWFIQSDGTVTWGNQSNGGGNLYYFPANTTVPQNQWTHIAVTISNLTVTHWINGNNAGSYTYTTGRWVPAGSSPSTFGFFRGLQCYFTGFRVSNTIRYSSNFTPNSTGFTTDSNTMLLIQPGATLGGIAGVTDTDGTLGDDKSGNGNNWSPYPGLTASDKVIDVPTNKFATLNPLSVTDSTSPVFSQGNLKTVVSSDGSKWGGSSTFGVNSGKYYFEVLCTAVSNVYIGIADETAARESARIDDHVPTSGNAVYYRSSDGGKRVLTNGTAVTSTYASTYTTTDIIGVAFDVNSSQVTFYKNNTSLGAITIPTTTENILVAVSGGTGSASNTFYLNAGQDSSFAGNKTAQGNTDDNGIGDFYYTPPSGYLALCTSNLPETGFGDLFINKPSDHFQTVTYTGNDTDGHSITGLDFQPDLVWIKDRTNAYNHELVDSVRGGTKVLFSNLTNAEQTETGSLSAFNSDGFTVNSNRGNVNASGDSYVAWCWKAGGTPVSNTDGDITSSVSANTTAGFSIVSYTGTSATNPATVGHGLSSTPELIMFKNRDASVDWQVYSKSIATSQKLYLNNTSGAAGTSNWNSTAPTSSVFTVNGTGSGAVNGNGEDIIAYCFHSVDGFSKVGSYTGNGSTDGTFVYTGFRPAFVMVKRTDSANYWMILDNARESDNPLVAGLYPNNTDAETNFGNTTGVDYLSNGFKHRDNVGSTNASGGTYIYMAFAEDPFKYSNAR